MKSEELVYRYSGTYHNRVNQLAVGETRNLKAASSVGEVQCASYSITDSCQIMSSRFVRKPRSMRKLLIDTAKVKTYILRISFFSCHS